MRNSVSSRATADMAPAALVGAGDNHMEESHSLRLVIDCMKVKKGQGQSHEGTEEKGGGRE